MLTRRAARRSNAPSWRSPRRARTPHRRTPTLALTLTLTLTLALTLRLKLTLTLTTDPDPTPNPNPNLIRRAPLPSVTA